MATLAQIRSALKTQLATISGLNAYVSRPATIVPPAAFPMPIRGSYNETLGGAPMYRFEIMVIVNSALVEEAQAALDLYLDRSGSKSIYANLHSQTLGGLALVKVGDWHDYDAYAFDTPNYLGARIDIEVYH